MGTISGSILAVFASMGIPAIHLLTASIYGQFLATIVIAKIIFPQTEKPYNPTHQDQVRCVRLF